MEDIADFLLRLYRAARERDDIGFQEFVFGEIEASFACSGGLWGVGGYLSADDNNFVPTRLASSNLDPAFLPEWSTAVNVDPVAAYIRPNRVRALRVHVPSFYADTPGLADVGKAYGIGSMTVISMPQTGLHSFEFMSLYRERADDACSEVEKRWLECIAPHLSEAGRIQRALHSGSPTDQDPAGGSIAVADAQRGRLLSAQPRFLSLLYREWKGFDGRHVPSALRDMWQPPGVFVATLRHGRIRGRRSGELVYMTAFDSENCAVGPTARQLQIADLYAQGLSSKQIARLVGIAPSTVRSHLSAVYDMLGVNNKVALARRLAESQRQA